MYNEKSSLLKNHIQVPNDRPFDWTKDCCLCKLKDNCCLFRCRQRNNYRTTKYEKIMLGFLFVIFLAGLLAGVIMIITAPLVKCDGPKYKYSGTLAGVTNSSRSIEFVYQTQLHHLNVLCDEKEEIFKWCKNHTTIDQPVYVYKQDCDQIGHSDHPPKWNIFPKVTKKIGMIAGGQILCIIFGIVLLAVIFTYIKLYL